MKEFCAVIAGGTNSGFENIEKASFIIACDKGYEYALINNIRPDLLIGDFDSYNGELPNDIPTLKLSEEKDDTDTMSAIRYCIAKGFKHIVLYCALGGRLDHFYANIQAGAYAARHGTQVKMFDNNNVIYIISNCYLTIPKKEGYSLSIFSLSDTCENVSIKGTKYSLDNETLNNTFPIGVSNEWIDDAIIKVGNGILIIMLSKL